MIPADQAAERYVLSAAIQSGGNTLPVGGLRAGDFHSPQHAQLWERLQSRVSKREPVEPSAVLADVAAIPGLDAGWLVKLLELSALPSSVPYYAATVRDRSVARAIIAAGTRVVAIGEQAPDAADIVEQANLACRQITEAAIRGSVTEDLAGDLESFMESLERPDSFTPTPWPELNEVIGGWSPQSLVVVAARPGGGKSLVGTCSSLYAASRGHHVAFASVEMTKNELYRRMVSAVGRVDHQSLVRKRLNDEEMRRAVVAQSKIAEMKLHVRDDLARPAEIISWAQSLTRDHGRLGLLIVDYLQLMRGDQKSNREQQVADMSRQLKLAAKQLEVPVLALAQLNRNADGRKPQVSDLRESGAIEQDADVVLLLHRDLDGATPDMLQMAVGKNRHGTSCVIDLQFVGRFQQINSLAPGAIGYDQ